MENQFIQTLTLATGIIIGTGFGFYFGRYVFHKSDHMRSLLKLERILGKEEALKEMELKFKKRQKPRFYNQKEQNGTELKNRVDRRHQ